MKVTISTLPGNDANFGTWLQFIALCEFLKQKFGAECSTPNKPFICDNMDCRDIFNDSFDYFKFKVESPDKSDFIVIGSDLVLCLNAPWYTEPFFNKFVKFDGIEDSRKIVYAASGLDMMRLKDSKYYQTMKNFKHLSFREKASYENNAMAEHSCWTYCIDPTLLHDASFYQQMEKRPDMILSDKFDVSYFPHQVPNNANAPSTAIELYNNPKIGLREFLWMMRNCRRIYTSSYHGSIFGLIFGRPVCNPLQSQFKTKELCNLLGISSDKNGEMKYDSNILWEIVRSERERSVKFFRDSFSSKVKRMACFAKCKLTRDLSASGGFCGTLAIHVLKNGGVVYGAAYIDNFRHVRTIKVGNVSDYFKLLAKSKYSFCQNCDFNEVKSDLESGKKVLFIGCPCQIKSLLNFLPRKFDNLTTVDLFCHGYSEPRVLEEFIDKIENEQNSKVVSLDMRKNHRIICSVKFIDGAEKEYDNVYSKFINREVLMPMCRECNMHYSNNQSDLTVGDFWQFKRDSMPGEFSPMLGTNVLTVNTEKGSDMLNELKTELEILEL